MNKYQDLSLTEKGLQLNMDTANALRHPMAGILPENIKELIRNLAATVADMGKEIDTLKGDGNG